MDLLVHSAAGTFIGWALPQRWTGPGATTRIMVAAALLPDADNLIPFLDPGSGFAHRGFTHSLCGVAVLAPLAALVAWRFSRQKRFARLLVWITVAMLSHIVLDLPTLMGVRLFFPFSRAYVHLDFLGYMDWTLITLGLFVLLAAWTYADRSVSIRRGILSAVLLSSLSWWLFSEWPTLAFSFAATVEEAAEEPFRTIYPLVLGGTLLVLLVAFARSDWGFRQSRAVFGLMGIAAFSIYLVICMTAQGIVLNQTRRFTGEQGIVVWGRTASRMGYSSLVGPFRWTGLVLAPEGVYHARIAPFGTRHPTFTLFPSSTDNASIARTRSVPEVRRFVSTAQFPVIRYRAEKERSIVEYQEYGLSWRPLLRVELNAQLEVLAVGWIDH